MSIFEKTPESWPAFLSDIINKIGFLGLIPIGIILIVIFCGNDDQKAQLVDIVFFQNSIQMHSFFFWGLVFVQFITYFVGKLRNSNKKKNVIEEQNDLILEKNAHIKMLKDALRETDPSNKALQSFVYKKSKH